MEIIIHYNAKRVSRFGRLRLTVHWLHN